MINLKFYAYVAVLMLVSSGLAKAESAPADDGVAVPGALPEAEVHGLVPKQDEPLLKLDDVMPDVDGTSILPHAINRNCPRANGAVAV